MCDDVLRAVDADAPAFPGVITESLAYSTLQSGAEFARWLAERGPATVPELPDPVVAQRTGGVLSVRFNRPQRHNAFSTDARAALLEALDVALLDPSVTEVVLGGNGRSFCSGGDLAEFGTFTDPATAHTWRAPGTAPRWPSTRSPPGSVPPVEPRCTVKCSAAGSRWRRSVATSRVEQAQRLGCPSSPSA